MANTRRAAQEDFLPLMRALVNAYQAFTACDAAGYREAGCDLTVPQADVIFTLGNTAGMTCKEIGEKTLITKGTLTGILDRLEGKQLIRRSKQGPDGRSTMVKLTRKGERVFEAEFPRQIAWLKKRFAKLSKTEMNSLRQGLEKLAAVF